MALQRRRRGVLVPSPSPEGSLRRYRSVPARRGNRRRSRFRQLFRWTVCTEDCPSRCFRRSGWIARSMDSSHQPILQFRRDGSVLSQQGSVHRTGNHVPLRCGSVSPILQVGTNEEAQANEKRRKNHLCPSAFHAPCAGKPGACRPPDVTRAGDA